MNISFSNIFASLFFIFTIFTFAPSTFAISIVEEEKLSVEFMNMVKEQRLVLYDPIVNNLVNDIGKIILSKLPTQPFHYDFYVINEDTFNAFASPAANIFVYTGLITSLDTVDELAGIIGHEIAHAESRHVSQSIDRSKMVNIGTMAGVLAGILVGGGSADLGQGLVIGTLAASQSAMLSFTRDNETEADEKGLAHLKKTCFSSIGLLNGLIKIRNADWRGVEGIPDYFKTHPGTKMRIAHIESMMASEKYKANQHSCDRDFRFDMIKQRCAALYGSVSDNEPKLFKLLEKEPENIAYLYGMATILARKARRKEAISLLQKALSKNFFDPMILLELGRIYLLDGEPKKAKNVLLGIENQPIIGLMATYHLGNARLELGDLDHAKKDFLNVIAGIPSAFPKAFYNLANIFSQQKQTGLSHYYLGLYYSELGRDKNTLFHLTKALKTISEKDKIKNAEKLIAKIKNQKNKMQFN